MKLIITTVRHEDEREALVTAVSILDIDGIIRDVNADEGILRDDDGIVAIWELVVD